MIQTKITTTVAKVTKKQSQNIVKREKKWMQHVFTTRGSQDVFTTCIYKKNPKKINVLCEKHINHSIDFCRHMIAVQSQDTK